MNDDPEAILPACREILFRQGDIEAVLSFLRGAGYSKMESIRALLVLTGCGLKEAKETVHLSRTWRDRRDADERLWYDLVDAMEEFEREHSKND